MDYKIVIETKRLILRELVINDFDSLYSVLADSDIMKHYPYTFDKKRVENWILKNIERYRVFGFGLWAVVLKETNEVIGDCGLTMQNINNTIKPEIGYHIRRNCQNKGYASEAAKACLEWCFTKTPFKVIYSYMHADNVPSYSVAIKNGMKLTDEYRNDFGITTKVFAIDKCDWNNIEK